MTAAARSIDPVDIRLSHELKHTSPLIGCRFDPSGRFLFVSAQDNTIQRYDLLAGTKTPFLGHESWSRAIAFIAPRAKEAEGNMEYERARIASLGALGARASILPSMPEAPFTLITGDYHGQLLWWAGESNRPKPIRIVNAHSGWVRAVAVAPGGDIVASCGNDQLVKLWSSDGRHLRTLEGHKNHVYNLAFHPDGTRLVSGDLKGIVNDWDLKSGVIARQLDASALYKYDAVFMAEIGGPRGIAFSKDGSRLACCGITNVSNAFAGVGNPLVLLYDWKEGKPKPLRPKTAFQGTAWGVAMHASGCIIAAGGGGQGRIWIWKQGETECSTTVAASSNARDLALHPDGGMLAIACFDGSAKMFTMTRKPETIGK